MFFIFDFRFEMLEMFVFLMVMWDCDFLVLGLGVVGLLVVLMVVWYGLWVIFVEKDSVLGGISVWLGGWIWVLCNLVV